MKETTNQVTHQQVKGLLAVVMAISEAIREAGEIPSGHLYAIVMGQMCLDDYERIIDTLKSAGVVQETSSHLLRWVGPKQEQECAA